MIYRWHFVTISNKADSMVTKRLREEEPAFPFFSWFHDQMLQLEIYMWILLPNIDLRCFVARQFLSQIYALLSVKFSGLKKSQCKKYDKYEVCSHEAFDFEELIKILNDKNWT